MAGYSYDDFIKAVGESGLGSEFSQEDMDLAKRYPEFGMSILNLKKDYHSATTQEQKLLANTAANQLRSSYGNYMGGANGASYVSGGKIPGQIDNVLDSLVGYGSFNFDQERPTWSNPYQGQIDSLLSQVGSYGDFSFDQARPEYSNPYQGVLDDLLGQMGNYGEFSYKDAPTYNNQYAQQQKELLDRLLNRPDFSWSKETDPLWGSYKKSYLREGERATANALAQASAASGGRTSSYAATAAAQAGDYYATKLNDIIPTLYQQAYQKYLDDYTLMQKDLSAVNQQEQLDYQKYLTDLGQYNTDRNFAYQDYMDDYGRLKDQFGAYQQREQMGYQQYLDALSQWNTDRNFAYNDYLDDFSRLQSQLGAYQQQGQLEYDQYLDALGQWNTDRDFAYGVYADDYNRLQSTLGALQGQDAVDYDRYMDELQQQQYREERDYERQQAQQALAQAQVDAMLGVGASPSAGLVGQSGYQSEYVQALENYYKQQAAAAVAAGSGGGRSGGSGGGSGSSGSGGTDDLVKRFHAGDQSDAVIQGLLDAGYTQAQIENAGYTGDFFRRSGGGGEAGYPYFGAAMRSLDTQLQQGKANNATVAALDSLWKRLSQQQKQQMQDLLDRYGLHYEE